MNKFEQFLSIFNQKKEKSKKSFHFSIDKKIVFILDSEMFISSNEINTLRKVFSKSNFYFWILLDHESNSLTNTYYFHKKYFNLFGKLKKAVLQEVIDDQYDILIDLSLQKGNLFNKLYEICNADLKISFSNDVVADLNIIQSTFNSEEYIKEIIRILPLYK